MKEIIVKSEDRGKRIDKYLTDEVGEISRGEVIRMIKSGVVVIGGKTVKKPSYTLKGDEVIEIGDYTDGPGDVVANKNIFLDIVENTKDFVVVDKPRGLQVHPSHRERENTLVNALLVKFPEIREVGDDPERPGIMHRLDKDTTGLIVVAKNQEAFDALKEQFSEREVKKTYHALVFGHLKEKVGEINAPIARATSYTKQKIAFGKYKGDAREALTKYEVTKEYRVGDLELSLIEVQPKTGRTHQIRVHMAHIGHPLLGDQRYYTKNERKQQVDIPKEYDIDTFYLHAKELSFTFKDQEYLFSVKYPDRFNALVHYLKAFEV